MKPGAALHALARLAEDNASDADRLTVLDAVIALGGIIPGTGDADRRLIKTLIDEAEATASALRNADGQQMKWQQVLAAPLTGGTEA